MKKVVSIFVVLSAITVASGAVLGGLYEATHELAENNILKFKKIPAVADMSELVNGKLSTDARAALEEELLREKRYVEIPGRKDPFLFFVVKKEGEPFGVAIEDFGQGFGGKLGVMAGFNLETDDFVGIGITTMSETPGLGTRVKEPAFAQQFVGMKKTAELKVKKDGGEIDAVSGATVSSRAVAEALRLAKETYDTHKQLIREAAAKPVAAPAKEATP